MIKVGSDFSGVGAFDYAIKRVNKNVETVFACDWDNYARQSYVACHGEPKYYPKDVYEREIPKESLDIYMTSPPCQAFSLAGKRKGKADKRGILFFNSLEFIQVNKPRYFIFENVKGLLSDDGGNTFQEWVNYLGGKSVNGSPVLFPSENSVPYNLYYKVLNSKKHGVPQNRERIFLVGIRDDIDNDFSFPKEEHLKLRLKDILEDQVDEKYFLSKKAITRFTNHDRSIGFKDPENYNVANCLISGYSKMPGDGLYLKIKSNTVKGVAQTLDTQCNQGVIKDFRIRKLTPLECFRLQDFPDSHVQKCIDAGVSNSQLYKQAGNSITVRVLELIIKKLKL